MRRIASSVSVITSFYEGNAHGMTATAVTSVSADPPTLLIVVNRSARSHAFIEKSRRFVVHVLSVEQTDLAKRFAAGVDDQFAGLDYTTDAYGCPLLSGVAATFSCTTSTVSEVATHTVFIGEVASVRCSEAMPLLYFDGAFRALAPTI